MEYSHLSLNDEVDFFSGAYWISGEDRIPYNGREVLCIIRDTTSFTSCSAAGCGTQFQGFRSILIPGFVTRYRYQKNKDGLEISDVEPIKDEDTRKAIREIVRSKYGTEQIELL